MSALQLAFEYQGRQHYEELGVYEGSGDNPGLDREKQEACAVQNITLIEVPHWWRSTPDALVSSIVRARPELARRPRSDSVLTTVG